MKKQHITEAALACFVADGYAGTSLAQIAAAVGLKKQSLYAHFADKDAIFLEALRYAKAQEIAFYDRFFTQATGDTKEVLRTFLQALDQHFSTSHSQRFWLRVNFYPPAHLAARVAAEVSGLYALYEAHLHALFATTLLQVDVQVAVDAFSGVTNALLADLLYATPPSVMARKIDASFAVFWQGVH